MTEQITLRLVVDGATDITVDRAAYEAAKQAGTTDELLAAAIFDVETEATVVEPGGTCVIVDTGLILPPPPPVYLIWSTRWSTWREQDGGRYNSDVWSAGRFDEAEARAVVEAITWPEGEPPPLVMVVAPEHGRMPFAAAEIRLVPEQMRKLVRLETHRRLRERQLDTKVGA
jgi:hypothetical protein